MFLEKLSVQNFRNYEQVNVSLKNGINVLIGNNAQGKTNLLESIYFLSTTKSYRPVLDDSLINNTQEFTRVSGILKTDNIKTNLEIYLCKKNKVLKIDNNEIKFIQDYLTHLRVIIFFPEDLDLIKSGPEVRRKYINTQICQIYNDYIKILNDYNKLLKNRNEYLQKQKLNEKYNKNYYEILTNYYVTKGSLLYIVRNKYINKINLYIGDIFENITGLKGLKVKYIPNIEINNFNEQNIMDNFMNEIVRGKKEEISYGKSIFGPHRDDIEFNLNERNLKIYGSQGQQRSAILALKLSEIQIFEISTGEKPILLLDDVFSELDNQKKDNLLKYIDSNIQSVITTTDLNNLNPKIVNKAKIFKIINGTIESIKGE